MKSFDQIREARVINTKKMSAYQKFAKAKRVDDDSVRMAHDNPNHPESKRMMKNKDFSKALGMYKAAKESTEVAEGIAGAVAGGVVGSVAGPAGAAAGAYLGHKIQQGANAAKKKKPAGPTTIGPDAKQKPAKRENSDAVKAFLAKGGKIKKLPPGRAQGAHGRDDPGKGMAGMLDRGDTKKFGTRKKVKSMEATRVAEMQIYRVGHKSVGGNVHARDTDHAMEILRNKGVKGKISLTHKGAVKDRIRNSKTGKPMAYAANEDLNEEMMFRVSVDGLPPMIMLGKSPGDIKAQLRKIVKQPSMIGDIDRMTKAEVKKRYRDMGQGKDKSDD